MMRAGRGMRILLLALWVVWGVAASPIVHAQSECEYPYLIEWPADNPVWKMCWVAPPNSSGVDASGLELRSVYYKGKLVLKRAHVPVINVKYDPGGCGGAYLSYRDWMYEYQAYDVDNVRLLGYAEPTTPPRTVCDHPGFDSGGFEGVALEKRADRLILTTQLRTTWYRYIQTWTFHSNGTIEPRIGFSAVDHFCTPKPHRHNAYWRFDVDLEDSINNVIEEYHAGSWSALGEAERLKDSTTDRRWRVRNTLTDQSLELIPGAEDDEADEFAVADVWALAYHDTELDDGGATSGPLGDAAHISPYIDGENIEDGTHDVVLWYRGGEYHNGDAFHCEIIGPTLRFGVELPSAPSNLKATAVSSVQINLKWTDLADNEDGYQIERSTDNVNFTPLDRVAANSTTYSDTGLAAGTAYFYRVRAFNAGGDSAVSKTSAAMTYGILRLAPLADAYVRDGSYASMNFGLSPILVAKLDRDNTGGNWNSYLKFNISNVKGVTTAILRIFGRLSDNRNPNLPTSAYASGIGWTERGITWMNQPASDAAALSTVTILNSTPRWYEFDVTPFIRAEKNSGHKIVSLVLKNTAMSVPQTKFNSREANMYRPILVVTQ